MDSDVISHLVSNSEIKNINILVIIEILQYF